MGKMPHISTVGLKKKRNLNPFTTHHVCYFSDNTQENKRHGIGCGI